jgi:dTDP-glucose 4,6-dehydratase
MTNSEGTSLNGQPLNPILVTGGCGFIGSNFVLDWLANEDAPVVNLDALTYAGNPENLAAVADDARYIFVRGNICDADLLERIFREHRPGAVVHFAAESPARFHR